MINAVLAASTEAPENDLPEDLDGFGEDDEGDEEEADDDDFEEVDRPETSLFGYKTQKKREQR